MRLVMSVGIAIVLLCLVGGCRKNPVLKDRHQQEYTLVARGVDVYRWSKDSRALFYYATGELSESSTIFRYDIRTGTTREIPAVVPFRGECDFSPDGKRMVCIAGTRLRIQDLDQRSTRTIYSMPHPEYDPASPPDAPKRLRNPLGDVQWLAADVISFTQVSTARVKTLYLIRPDGTRLQRLPLKSRNFRANEDGSGFTYYAMASANKGDINLFTLNPPKSRRFSELPQDVGIRYCTQKAVLCRVQNDGSGPDDLRVLNPRTKAFTPVSMPGVDSTTRISPDGSHLVNLHVRYAEGVPTELRLYTIDKTVQQLFQ